MLLESKKSQAENAVRSTSVPLEEPQFVGRGMSQEDQKTWVAVTKRLEEKLKRPVQNEDYVKFAQTKAGHCIHHLFEWDDSKAAHAHRLAQAGFYCRAVQVLIGEGPNAQPIRAIVNVTRTDGQRGMTTSNNLGSNTEYREAFLEQIAREAKYFAEKLKTWRAVLGSETLLAELRKFGISFSDEER